MHVRNFLSSKAFLKHFTLALGITLAVIFLVLTSLKVYTLHGKSVQVPDLYGLTENEFAEILDDANLEYVISDSTYINEVAAGGVIDQVPEPGQKVKKGRKLFLTLNAVSPEMVPVPPLTDISLRQSLSQIESAGLLPGDITYQPSEFRNLVLAAQIGGRKIITGEMVPKGTKIDLIIGSGQESGMIYLPDLTGLPLLTARQVLAENLLSVGAVVYDNSIVTRNDSLNARVWRQQPDASSVFEVNIGSSVDIWVSMDENKLIESSEEEEENFENFGF
jgi:eukaryotic-like serine/threonine-protein kinase